ncbi:MAG: hypothetical protein AAF629_30200, partial [Chloroflexota bacterium]
RFTTHHLPPIRIGIEPLRRPFPIGWSNKVVLKAVLDIAQIFAEDQRVLATFKRTDGVEVGDRQLQPSLSRATRSSSPTIRRRF